MMDPGGKSLMMSPSILVHSPFSDFFYPGISLFTTNGVSSAIVSVFVFLRVRNYPLLIMYQGAVLSGWIGVQMTMVRPFHVFQFVYGFLGILLIVLGMVLLRMNKNDSLQRN